MRNTRYGFSLVELMIALAITALLMAAVAVAINASVINYQENEDIFKTVNTARQALTRITTQLRTAQAVATPEANSQCTFDTVDGNNITYRYNSSNNSLYLDDNDANTSDLLCDNVTAMEFRRQTFTEGSTIYVKSVQVYMTIVSGNVQREVCSAVVIRKNLR